MRTQVEKFLKKKENSPEQLKAVKMKISCSIAEKLPSSDFSFLSFSLYMKNLDKKLGELLKDLRKYDFELPETKMFAPDTVVISSNPFLCMRFNFVIGVNADDLEEVEKVLRRHEVSFPIGGK